MGGITKMIDPIVGSLLGGGDSKSTSTTQIVQEAPAPKSDVTPDADALARARQRMEQEKLRRGRSSLRKDLSYGSSGAGVSIPT